MPFKIIKGAGDAGPKKNLQALSGYIGVGLVIGVVAIAAISRVGCVNEMTPAGHEGYIRSNPIFGQADFVGIQEGPTSTGWVWRQQVVNIDVRPKTYSEEMKILTAERLELSFRVHARIRLRRGETRMLVERFGGNEWYRSNVQQQLRSVVRAMVQELETFEVKDQMAEIATSVLESMQERYKETPVEFLSVDIGDIQYPKIVVQSVVRKFVTNEENERRDIELQIAQRQIEIGIAEAEGIADAQTIIATTLDPMFVQYEALRAIERLATSKNTTFVLSPIGKDGSSPMIMSLDR